MIRTFAFAVAIAASTSTAFAADQFTMQQCITINNGLVALSNGADGKQYKLGNARMTIALNLAALNPIVLAAQKAQQGFVGELPPLPPASADPVAQQARQDATNEQNKRVAKYEQTILGQPCPVALGRLNVSDLKLGDMPDENAIPPAVLSGIVPILDGLK